MIELLLLKYLTGYLFTQESRSLGTGDMECIFAAGLVTLHTRSVGRFRFSPRCLQTDVTNLKKQCQSTLSITKV